MTDFRDFNSYCYTLSNQKLSNNTMDRGKDYKDSIRGCTLHLLLRFHLRSNGADRGPDSGLHEERDKYEK
jgi:hypothetical protein